ncbi:hypothetical protein FB45DRAFT_832693 [Roridomyces roridus]|uniref:Glycosyltransferase family 18 catalytic domain-containing protein n=1 Tax=Roridomyces roridus TaxID=1738132 RepID=A0AAD7BXU0_9AGAR|nr:hypothetical protein FB45DRAFT_832693 [Roridomyces roridus]
MLRPALPVLPPPPPPPPVVNLKPAPLNDTLFPPMRASSDSWLYHNQMALRALFQCLGTSAIGCHENQTKVVILGSYHFRQVLWGHVGGEDIWARSTVQALKNMGYTYLYSDTEGRTLQLYQMFPDLVKAILMEDSEAFQCFKDGECVQGSWYNTAGLPIWKIFSFAFWVPASHPLGHDWTLSPEPYNEEHSWYTPNTYLGYSVEPGCLKHPYIPSEVRISPPQVFILGKNMAYFNDDNHAWKADFYDTATKELGVEFLAGAQGDVVDGFPKSVQNVGPMPQDKFFQTIAESAILIGVGMPWTSPTPYDALCLGVPFLNPISDWDHDDPTNRDKWSGQQGLLKDMNPPYVYNVFKGDKEGFIKAIKDALANPIGDRYILPRMRMSAVEQRLGAILERDWKTHAEGLLKRKQEKGEEPVSLLLMSAQDVFSDDELQLFVV